MKKKFIYILFLVFVALVLGSIFINYKNSEDANYNLLERRDAASRGKEWELTQQYASTLLQSLKKNPADAKSSLALAAIFIQEARVTGNYVYYDRAAMRY